MTPGQRALWLNARCLMYYAEGLLQEYSASEAAYILYWEADEAVANYTANLMIHSNLGEISARASRVINDARGFHLTMKHVITHYQASKLQSSTTESGHSAEDVHGVFLYYAPERRRVLLLLGYMALAQVWKSHPHPLYKLAVSFTHHTDPFIDPDVWAARQGREMYNAWLCLLSTFDRLRKGQT